MLATHFVGNIYLVGIPMLGILFAAVFRLDELIGQTGKRKPRSARPRLSGWDPDGKVRCADPDEKLQSSTGIKSRIVTQDPSDS